MSCLGPGTDCRLLDVNQHGTLTPFAYPVSPPACGRSALGLPDAGRGCRGQAKCGWCRFSTLALRTVFEAPGLVAGLNDLAMVVRLMSRRPIPPLTSKGARSRNALAWRRAMWTLSSARARFPTRPCSATSSRAANFGTTRSGNYAKRAPDTSRDWLDHIERSGLWSSLMQCHVRGRADEDTDIRLLRFTLAWIEGKRKPAEKVPAPAQAEETLKPIQSCDDEGQTDGDPDTPKP